MDAPAGDNRQSVTVDMNLLGSERCPRCGERAVPLLYGLPTPDAEAAARAGDLVLGGCFTPDNGPDHPYWVCANDHRWREDDVPKWDARLLAVLREHGDAEER